MKMRLLTFLFASIVTTSLFAQTLDDGKKLFSHQRYQSAKETFRKLTGQQPNDAFAWYWLVRSDFELNLVADAKVQFAKMPAEIKESPIGRVTQGFLQLLNGDTVAAKQSFETAIGNKRKKDPAIQLAVAEANIEAPGGNLAYAIATLEEAAKRDKKNPEIYTSVGDAYRKQYNGSEAAKAYLKAIDEDKKYAEAYYKLGKIYQTQNSQDIFIDYYNKAIAADPKFAPVYYQLYYYYYFHDLDKARENLNLYIANTDKSINNDYMLTDLMYVSKNYHEAIDLSKKIIAAQDDKTKPRIYKLMAYSYAELSNYPLAEENLNQYFKVENDTNFVAKDFDLMGRIYDSTHRSADAAVWYGKAYNHEKDSTRLLDYAKKLADFYKKDKDYADEAFWLGKSYQLNKNATNLDLFYWGIANYNAKNYPAADSVFAIYENKYPDQTFGYFWRAKSNAAIDTAMETGAAVPHYEKLIAIAGKDTANINNKKWLIQAYGYLAAFKANKEKQYNDALAYYEKVLELDPGNSDAERYKQILEKMIESSKEPSKPAN